MKTGETSELERFKKSWEHHNLLDVEPNKNHDQTFAKVLRPRNRSRELGSPAFRFGETNERDRLVNSL